MPRTELMVRPTANLSWFGRVRQTVRSYMRGPYTWKAYPPWMGESSRTLAGPVVNEVTAFTVSAVWAAVSTIAGDIANLPLVLYRSEGDTKRPYYESKTYKLLHDEANPEMTASVARRAVMACALLYGNGFAEIVRDVYNRPIQWWPIHPARVEIERERGRRGDLVYVVDGTTRISAMNMIHLPGLSLDGLEGMNLVASARQALGLALAAEQFGAAFFGNGSAFGGLLTPEPGVTLDDEQIEELRAKIAAVHERADKAFRLLILGGGLTFTKLGVNPTDAQMDAVRTHQIYEVARFFTIPPHKLMQLDRSTNNNIEHQGLEYATGCLLRWIRPFEQELNRKLIPALEYRQQYVEHSLEGFLRGDHAARGEFYAKLFAVGAITQNQIRALENWNPVPGGDETYIPVNNLVPSSRVNEWIDAQIQKLTAKPAPPGTGGEGPTRGELQAATERAERAETLLADAQAAVVRTSADLSAAVATQDTSEARMAELREAASRAQVAAESWTAQAQAAQAEVTALRGQAQSVEGSLRAEVERRAEAEARAQIAAELAEEARQRSLEADSRAALAAEAVAAAEGRTKVAEARAADAMARAQTSDGDAVAAIEKQMEAENRAAEARAEQARMQAEYDAKCAAAEDARQAAIAAKADCEREIAAALAEVEREANLRADAEAQKAAAEAKIADAEAVAVREAAERVRVVEDRDAVAAEAAATAAEAQALAEKRRAERLALIASYRAMFVDVIGRIRRRETSRARNNQSKPAHFKRWLASFDAEHAPVCVQSLLPVLRGHLAFVGSTVDPVAEAERFVAEALAEFHTRMETVIAAPPADFHAHLERALAKWESDTAVEMVADRFAAEEMTHAG